MTEFLFAVNLKDKYNHRRNIDVNLKNPVWFVFLFNAMTFKRVTRV